MCKQEKGASKATNRSEKGEVRLRLLSQSLRFCTQNGKDEDMSYLWHWSTRPELGLFTLVRIFFGLSFVVAGPGNDLENQARSRRCALKMGAWSPLRNRKKECRLWSWCCFCGQRLLAKNVVIGMRNAAPANAKNKDILLLGKEGTMLSPWWREAYSRCNFSIELFINWLAERRGTYEATRPLQS